MGCSSLVKKPKVSDPVQATEQEARIIAKIRELGLQFEGVGSNAELELIHQTFLSLHDIDLNRRNIWLQALHNDILAPLYFSKLEHFKYNASNPFIPRDDLLQELRSKDFDTIIKPKDELRECLLHIFWDHIKTFDVDIVKMQRFIVAVCENYQDNPFHNLFHAFSVCQMIFTLSEKNNKFGKFLLPMENFALFLSGLGHDLNHPGVTNVFMINSRHPLAVRYNDISVLENHHAATLMKFLELPGCDILSSMSHADQTHMRKIIIPTVLATDMAKHNFVMEHFISCMREFNIENGEHRQSFLDIVLHACDVGNPVFKFELATVWSLRIIQEFNEQVWKEEQNAIPISEFMRIGSDINKIKRNQIGFIDMFIHPLWMLLGNHIDGIDDYLESIEDNRRSWEKIQNL
ncbi:hypothetical protein SteCoe_22067 [Stentor coeruleus]|uniref:PDEase domain-containing protein n=1 Tax=Stentor coeruleus TaxID=5963 RepID=A0A1R2BNM7_9CILI|nr:hypothetical protein SteCoe_22067 [Stentor coeruleus]